MFNPTFIPLGEEFTFEDSNKDNDDGNPRAVFLYYDPIGERSACNKVPANLGLPAFLNFAFCHLTSLDGDQRSKDLQSFFPFGNVNQHTNVFAGSARFPQVVFARTARGQLPVITQDDRHLAGIAVVVSILVILGSTTEPGQPQSMDYSRKYTTLLSAPSIPVVEKTLRYPALSEGQVHCVFPLDFIRHRNCTSSCVSSGSAQGSLCHGGQACLPHTQHGAPAR